MIPVIKRGQEKVIEDGDIFLGIKSPLYFVDITHSVEADPAPHIHCLVATSSLLIHILAVITEREVRKNGLNCAFV